MAILIFDTETTSLDKPFCYDLGYLICDEEMHPLAERSFVIEQTWHNLPLFQSAYYADKRPLYVNDLRARKMRLVKWGYATQVMMRDLRAWDVTAAFAYNSNFDERVFAYNCDWFKTLNPLETVPVADIRGFAHRYLVDDAFREWCEKYGEFTETGNYSTTAQTMFRYITNAVNWEEAHTALEDSHAEAFILSECLLRGAHLDESPKALRSIERKQVRNLSIVDGETKEELFARDYERIRISKDKTRITVW